MNLYLLFFTFIFTSDVLDVTESIMLSSEEHTERLFFFDEEVEYQKKINKKNETLEKKDLSEKKNSFLNLEDLTEGIETSDLKEKNNYQRRKKENVNTTNKKRRKTKVNIASETKPIQIIYPREHMRFLNNQLYQ
ncbi:hypothetical protein NGRA_2814 [Nosema granulosis]|uniref:Uncharacterized protein n=1 Tax=Nosema granulosis TaxID=83296 RepID=A0A9P6KY31_9MICR|nr:hypothetical protein NGRA_2814 [Nosema granulosis]